MVKAVTSLLVLLAFSACAHEVRRSVSTVSGANYQAALDEAFAEIESHESAARRPANLDIDLQRLSRVSPGKFMVYVFPKMRVDHHKSNEGSEPLFKTESDERFSQLAAPLEFEVSTLAESSCEQFIDNNLFAKWNGKDYFDPKLSANKGRRCAIIEVTSMNLQKASRDRVRRDDVLRMRLYLDDQYALYGREVDKFDGQRKIQTVKVRVTESQRSSANLSFFPVEIPTLDVLGGPGASRGELDARKLIDSLATAQVQKRYMRTFVAPKCQGTEVRFQDDYGSQVTVGWCDGVPFPQFMETPRFVAVTEPLSVR